MKVDFLSEVFVGYGKRGKIFKSFVGGFLIIIFGLYGFKILMGDFRLSEVLNIFFPLFLIGMASMSNLGRKEVYTKANGKIEFFEDYFEVRFENIYSERIKSSFSDIIKIYYNDIEKIEFSKDLSVYRFIGQCNKVKIFLEDGVEENRQEYNNDEQYISVLDFNAQDEINKCLNNYTNIKIEIK